MNFRNPYSEKEMQGFELYIKAPEDKYTEQNKDLSIKMYSSSKPYNVMIISDEYSVK